MTRMGFVFNLDTCLDHRGCMTACKVYNKTPMGVYNTETLTSTTGEYPESNTYFFPRICQQCDNPSCLGACEAGAIVKRDDGIVDIADPGKCAACDGHPCEAACPFGGIHFDAGDGRAYKCNLCAERLDAGLEPRCVGGCLTGSRLVGDFDDECSMVSAIAQQLGESLYSLDDPNGNGPNARYLLTKHEWAGQRGTVAPNWHEKA